MLTIVTKYLGPTDTKGTRIKADAGLGRTIIIPYAHELDSEGAHRRAAIALCRKMNWTGKLCVGATESGHVYILSTKSGHTFANVD